VDLPSSDSPFQHHCCAVVWLLQTNLNESTWLVSWFPWLSCSVKLRWIASCFMECDHPSITDILFASEICLYFDTTKYLCFLYFMMLAYIFIAAFVWVLSVKYTFYIKSRLQCLWLGPSEAWILTNYCTLKYSSALLDVFLCVMNWLYINYQLDTLIIIYS